MMGSTRIDLCTLILACVALVAGCKSAADRYLEQHPNLPEKMRSAIAEERPILGMDRQQVRAALGKPDIIGRSASDSTRAASSRSTGSRDSSWPATATTLCNGFQLQSPAPGPVVKLLDARPVAGAVSPAELAHRLRQQLPRR